MGFLLRSRRKGHRVFLSPALFYPVPLILFPLLYLLYASLQSWSLPGTPQFAGLSNYIALLSANDFYYSLFVTLVFTAVAVGIELVLGLSFALLLFGEGKVVKVVRLVSLIPLVWAPAVVALDWRLIYDTSFGPVNFILRSLGFGIIDIFSTSGQGLSQWIGILVVDLWQWTPFVSLILLSGLYSIGLDIYESARVDGGSSLQIFRRITLPLLRPAVIIALLFRTVDALRTFDNVFVLTNGGPGIATETLSMQVYRYTFHFFNIGYGAAESIVFGILVAAITGTIILTFKETILRGV